LRGKIGRTIYLDIIESWLIYESDAEVALLLGFWRVFKKILVLRRIPLYLAATNELKTREFSNERYPYKGTKETISKVKKQIGWI